MILLCLGSLRLLSRLGETLMVTWLFGFCLHDYLVFFFSFLLGSDTDADAAWLNESEHQFLIIILRVVRWVAFALVDVTASAFIHILHEDFQHVSLQFMSRLSSVSFSASINYLYRRTISVCWARKKWGNMGKTVQLPSLLGVYRKRQWWLVVDST